PSNYKNIVTLGIRLKEFDWTDRFIEKYKETLAPQFRQNAYTYNLASYYVGKKEYKSALKLLQKVEFVDVFYHLDAKAMMLRMYYELDDTEALESLMQTFKAYLNRNKLISNYQNEVYLNLIKYTQKVF